MKDAVLEDSNLAAVYVKYSSGFHRLENLLTSNRQRELQVVWIHGPSGSGKTRLACELSTKLFGEEGWWMSSGSLQWFDGYSRHKCVILDELRFEHVKYSISLDSWIDTQLQSPSKEELYPGFQPSSSLLPPSLLKTRTRTTGKKSSSSSEESLWWPKPQMDLKECPRCYALRTRLWWCLCCLEEQTMEEMMMEEPWEMETSSSSC